MKLPLDENLSRRLVPFLQEAYPGTSQVALVGLESVTDRALWDFARAQDYVLVTRDADFEEPGILNGAPPYVIWLRGNNPDRGAILKLLLENRIHIESAITSGIACVELHA